VFTTHAVATTASLQPMAAPKRGSTERGPSNGYRRQSITKICDILTEDC